MTSVRTVLSMAQMLVAAGSLCAAVAAPARASTVASYNGDWSVVITTQKGECDRAYRYPLKIHNGVVAYGGGADFTVSGKVAKNGAVTVKVSRGSQSAAGSGRLAENAGNGEWSGGACSGTWTAERR